MEATLNLELRGDAGKGVARKLRRAGRSPRSSTAEAEAPVMVSVEAQEALHLFQAISVENTILNLSLGDATERVLVREVQTHPFRPEILHCGLPSHPPRRADRSAGSRAPLRIAAGVRIDGGRMDQVTHDIPVKCVPSKIPEAIEVDVTSFAVGDVLRAGDLDLPDDVENLADPGLVICGVASPTVSLDEEDEAAEDVYDEDGPVAQPESDGES